ncbi:MULTISPECIES: glutamate--cysteine ligase [unclassified Actinomyces]|uniref:carboxylate-amine ligase n=1 Tax=unclassified Actinomyces TaxID=2609248 RepID=UPI00201765AA|nr:MULTISPECIES: glutamate--cysteine ligase [unclassified Actinomyces]MCL3776549.1 glutamate--cysteine ligase [Actinomyces sp. AC-20-1]MCL3788835.1 glutamate--cysteine ligase [Actinomyces sp. 187325]MCL3791059.1 glutamate--cysteine ligase [Actinomyces sp. 186855]MCL3793415.1 glutamate--cysteine ligase [Actinomyces sp. 217892]
MRTVFARSPRSSVGVEWELQVVDPATGRFAPIGPDVLDELEAAGAPGVERVHKEMHRGMIELVSARRTRVPDALADLAGSLDLVSPAFAAHGAALTSAGAHPFEDPGEHEVTCTPRYSELVERTRWWGRQMLIFGTHVHVGVDDVARAVPVLNHMATYIGHLQAVAASSPTWAGQETGYADNRAMMFQQLPNAGLPEPVSTWQDFEDCARDLARAGAIREVNELRWDVRPSPAFGTVEVRACDACSNLAEVGAVAALVHCLVEEAARTLDAGRALRRLPHWLLAANKWRSARYGLDAVLVEEVGADPVPLRESLPALVSRLEPVAEDLGCAAELARVSRVLALGNGSERQLAVARSAQARGEVAGLAVARHLLAETAAGGPLAPERS